MGMANTYKDLADLKICLLLVNKNIRRLNRDLYSYFLGWHNLLLKDITQEARTQNLPRPLNCLWLETIYWPQPSNNLRKTKDEGPLTDSTPLPHWNQPVARCHSHNEDSSLTLNILLQNPNIWCLGTLQSTRNSTPLVLNLIFPQWLLHKASLSSPNLHHHLAYKTQFLDFWFPIPKTPATFGLITISHFIRCILLLLLSCPFNNPQNLVQFLPHYNWHQMKRHAIHQICNEAFIKTIPPSRER